MNLIPSNDSEQWEAWLHHARSALTVIYGGSQLLRSRWSNLRVEDRDALLADIDEAAKGLSEFLKEADGAQSAGLKPSVLGDHQVQPSA